MSAALITRTVGGSRVSAYTGFEITTAADLSEAREFDRLDEWQRHTKAVDAQITWLAAQLSGEPSGAFEVRWLTDPATQRLRLVALARVDAPSSTEAAMQVAHVQQRLRGVPPHVYATPIADEAELVTILKPFMPASRGMVDIRKRCLLAYPNRPDARVRFYLAVQPFTFTARPWTILLQTLATHPAPLVLSIGLMPVVVSSQFARVLDVNATHYARLARDGEWRLPGALS